MALSTSQTPRGPTLKGVVIDANVLSLLAKAKRLELLQQVAKLPLYVSSTIHRELEIGIERGVLYLVDVFQMLHAENLQVISPNIDELQMINSLPSVLARGEAEAITICQSRDLIFVTHDRKAANYCERMGIPCIRFKVLLAEFERAGLLTTSEVQAILL